MQPKQLNYKVKVYLASSGGLIDYPEDGRFAYSENDPMRLSLGSDILEAIEKLNTMDAEVEITIKALEK